MTNLKVTELAALAALADADLMHVIDDVAGTPVNKSVLVSLLKTFFTTIDQTSLESGASVVPTDLTVEEGFIERYGGAVNTNSTTAFEKAASIGRLDIRFLTAGRTATLNDYSEFYILRDAFVDGHSVIGPANFASDGTQTESILRLGRDPDFSNGFLWRFRTVRDITFSGKIRADNAISIGADNNFPDTGDVSWNIELCFFERCNIGIKKQQGNFGQTINRCSFSSCMYGYWAQGYPIQTTIDVAEASGQTVLSVANTVGANDLDEVRILMDDDSIHPSTIASVDASAGTITINDATDDTAAVGNFVKIYHPDFGVPGTLSHIGSDTFQKGEFSGCYKAAIYMDAQQVGSGQTSLRDVIIEENPGFGIFVRDYNGVGVPLRLENVWFEDNGEAANTYNIDPDAIAESQTPGGAGNFTLDGAETSGGVYAPTTGSREISFTSASNESGDTYTITGTDDFGVAQVENLSGPNATTVFSVNSFATITQIATDGAATGAITIGVTGKVDLGDGFGLREPQDIYFENVDRAIISGSQMRLCTFIDSNVTLDHCKFQADDVEFIVTNTDNINYLRITNAHIDGWGESKVGANLVEIESLIRTNRPGGGGTNRCWRAPQLTPTRSFEVASGVIRETDTGDTGEEWIDTAGSPVNVARDGYVEGLSYETAAQYTFAVSKTYRAPAPMATPETTAGKWYVLTLEVKVDANIANLDSLGWGGDYDFTRGDADFLLTQGEWATIANVAQLDTGNSGIIRPTVTTNSGGTVQMTFGASQIIEFPDAQDAYTFYNKNIHIHQRKSSKRVKRTNNPSRATTTTLADDPDLLGWNLQEDTWYKVEGDMILDTDATADWKFQFVFTNSPQSIAITMDSVTQSSGGRAQTAESAVSLAGAAAIQPINWGGVFQTDATTGGSVDFQWAQNTSNVYATRLNEGSWIKISKLFDED